MGDTSTLIADLTETRRLVEVGWVQKYAATNAEGKRVDPWDPSAVCWCLSGALQKATGMTTPQSTNRYLEALSKLHATLKYKIISWNDKPGRTREEVLEALDNALQYVAKKPK